MSSAIGLTAAATEVPLDGGHGSTTVSVTNTADQAQRIVLGVFNAAPPAPAGTPVESVDAAGWATVDRPLREFAPGSTESYLVRFEAGSAAAGRYDVRLIAYSADEAPEEHSNPAQTITVVVGESPPEPRKRRPWLLIGLIAALVLAIAGVAAWLLLRDDGGVPSVIGSTQADAEEQLAEAGLTAVAQERFGPRPIGVVFEQSPGAGEDIPDDRTVAITIAIGIPNEDLKGLILPQALVKIGASAGIPVEGLSTEAAQEQLAPAVNLTIDLPPAPPMQVQRLQLPVVKDVQSPGDEIARGDDVRLVAEWTELSLDLGDFGDIAELPDFNLPGF